jgi:hypothetical protein
MALAPSAATSRRRILPGVEPGHKQDALSVDLGRQIHIEHVAGLHPTRTETLTGLDRSTVWLAANEKYREGGSWLIPFPLRPAVGGEL